MQRRSFLVTLLALLFPLPRASATPEPGEDGAGPRCYTKIIDGFEISIDERSSVSLSRDYSTGVPLVARERLFFRTNPNTVAYEQAEPRVKRLITLLFMIPGITQLSLNSNRVRIWIDMAFEWESVQPWIIHVIGAVLSEKPCPLYWDEPERIVTALEYETHPYMRSFHVDRLINSGETTTFGPTTRKSEWEAGQKMIGERGSKIATELREKIGGDLQRICFDTTYQLSVSLKPDCSWTTDLEDYVDVVIRAAIRNKPMPKTAPQPYIQDESELSGQRVRIA